MKGTSLSSAGIRSPGRWSLYRLRYPGSPVFRKSSEFAGKVKNSAPESYLADMHLANSNNDWHMSKRSPGATRPCYLRNRPTELIWSLEINFIKTSSSRPTTVSAKAAPGGRLHVSRPIYRHSIKKKAP
jgi:hypothetical protein